MLLQFTAGRGGHYLKHQTTRAQARLLVANLFAQGPKLFRHRMGRGQPLRDGAGSLDRGAQEFRLRQRQQSGQQFRRDTEVMELKVVDLAGPKRHGAAGANHQITGRECLGAAGTENVSEPTVDAKTAPTGDLERSFLSSAKAQFLECKMTVQRHDAAG